MDEHRRFEIGDKVRVLFIDGYSARNFELMRLSVGKILTVIKVIHDDGCDLQLDNEYWYAQEWLQPQDDYSEISKRLAIL